MDRFDEQARAITGPLDKTMAKLIARVLRTAAANARDAAPLPPQSAPVEKPEAQPATAPVEKPMLDEAPAAAPAAPPAPVPPENAIYFRRDDWRDWLGREVRRVWILWASEQPTPKASWLVEWDGLSESDREVDRRIGEVLFAHGARAGSKAFAHVTTEGDHTPNRFFCGACHGLVAVDEDGCCVTCGTDAQPVWAEECRATSPSPPAVTDEEVAEEMAALDRINTDAPDDHRADIVRSVIERLARRKQ